MIRQLSTAIITLLLSCSLLALEIVPVDEPAPRYIAHIQLNTADELHDVLLRAEQLLAAGTFAAGKDSPIVFVLHGPEARVFFHENYNRHKSLVDLAARLSAFQVVDVRVCETWAGGAGLRIEDLPPFVETVPYGPDEKRRLMEKENYIYF